MQAVSPTWKAAPPARSVDVVKPLLLQRPDATNQLAYALFLLVNATVFLRPGEMFPLLMGLPIYEGSILACFACTLNGVRDRLSPAGLQQQPLTLCVIGVGIACVMSHVTHAYLGGLIDGVDLYLKTALYYFLLITVIDTPRRLHWLIVTTVICASIMISLCVIDYIEWVDFTFVEHITDRDEVTEDGEVKLVVRMRGTGIFEDPNDISLLIIGTAILSAYLTGDKRQGVLRWLWLLPIALMVFALICTRSRGGLLSGVAAVLTYIMLRYGRGWSIVVGAVGMMALPLLAGRQGNIDIADGTGQDRIQLWSEGLAEIKSSSLFFGIGQGMYADAVGLVAHNSFVHAFVELGLFGGVWFFGCFFFTGLGLYRICDPRVRLRDPELMRATPYLAGLLAGWSLGLFSLSRCYVVPTYLVLGLLGAFISICGVYAWPQRYFIKWDRWHQKWMVIAGFLCLTFHYVFIRVFARFG